MDQDRNLRDILVQRRRSNSSAGSSQGVKTIATGSTAARNDIIANTFHLVASQFATNISGFSTPIGGYEITSHGPGESSTLCTPPPPPRMYTYCIFA